MYTKALAHENSQNLVIYGQNEHEKYLTLTFRILFPYSETPMIIQLNYLNYKKIINAGVVWGILQLKSTKKNRAKYFRRFHDRQKGALTFQNP